jgi:hypothetical protein
MGDLKFGVKNCQYNLQGASNSNNKTKKPLKIVAIDSKTALFEIYSKFPILKTWPKDETKQRPVDVTTKKI